MREIHKNTHLAPLQVNADKAHSSFPILCPPSGISVDPAFFSVPFLQPTLWAILLAPTWAQMSPGPIKDMLTGFMYLCETKMHQSFIQHTLCADYVGK